MKFHGQAAYISVNMHTEQRRGSYETLVSASGRDLGVEFIAVTLYENSKSATFRINFKLYTHNKKTITPGLSPLENYTDRATAGCL
jgi:hypothetical protein